MALLLRSLLLSGVCSERSRLFLPAALDGIPLAGPPATAGLPAVIEPRFAPSATQPSATALASAPGGRRARSRAVPTSPALLAGGVLAVLALFARRATGELALPAYGRPVAPALRRHPPLRLASTLKKGKGGKRGGSQKERRQSLLAGIEGSVEPRAPVGRAIDDPAAPLALAAVRAGDDRKASEISAVRVSHLTYSTDFFVNMTGRSKAQINAIVKNIEDEVFEQFGRNASRQGKALGGWVCLDFDSVVVNVFAEEQRGFYGVDKLWAGGQALDLSNVLMPDAPDSGAVDGDVDDWELDDDWDLGLDDDWSLEEPGLRTGEGSASPSPESLGESPSPSAADSLAAFGAEELPAELPGGGKAESAGLADPLAAFGAEEVPAEGGAMSLAEPAGEDEADEPPADSGWREMMAEDGWKEEDEETKVAEEKVAGEEWLDGEKLDGEAAEDAFFK